MPTQIGTPRRACERPFSQKRNSIRGPRQKTKNPQPEIEYSTAEVVQCFHKCRHCGTERFPNPKASLSVRRRYRNDPFRGECRSSEQRSPLLSVPVGPVSVEGSLRDFQLQQEKFGSARGFISRDRFLGLTLSNIIRRHGVELLLHHRRHLGRPAVAWGNQDQHSPPRALRTYLQTPPEPVERQSVQPDHRVLRPHGGRFAEWHRLANTKSPTKRAGGPRMNESASCETKKKKADGAPEFPKSNPRAP